MGRRIDIVAGGSPNAYLSRHKSRQARVGQVRSGQTRPADTASKASQVNQGKARQHRTADRRERAERVRACSLAQRLANTANRNQSRFPRLLPGPRPPLARPPRKQQARNTLQPFLQPCFVVGRSRTASYITIRYNTLRPYARLPSARHVPFASPGGGAVWVCPRSDRACIACLLCRPVGGRTSVHTCMRAGGRGQQGGSRLAKNAIARSNVVEQLPFGKMVQSWRNTPCEK